VTARERLARLLPLPVGAHEQVAQPHDALQVAAGLREPVGPEHAVDAGLVLGEQGRERIFAQLDRAHSAGTVAVQVAKVVDVAAELVERAARLDQVIAADDLAEHGPDAVERGLDPHVERLELDVELRQEPAARVR
jgi:hypothetical protein